MKPRYPYQNSYPEFPDNSGPRTQRGFIALPAMAWAAIGAAVIIGGLGIALKIEHSGKLAAEAQVSARDATIRQQNAAVQQLKTDGDRKIAEATKGVVKAKASTQKARTEAERLRVLASQPGKPGACLAAQGVAEIRKGL